MKLSANLTLEEVIKSQVAIRYDIDNTPTEEHLENLKILATFVFQDIRDHFNTAIYISSGYRSKELNSKVKGSITSQHCSGQAIDIDQDGRSWVTNEMIFNYIKDNLEFTQLIWEYSNKDGSPAWVHVSYDKNNLKREVLKASKVNNKTVYTKWTT